MNTVGTLYTTQEVPKHLERNIYLHSTLYFDFRLRERRDKGE
jgi:hypothetical protein